MREAIEAKQSYSSCMAEAATAAGAAMVGSAKVSPMDACASSNNPPNFLWFCNATFWFALRPLSFSNKVS